MMALNGLRVLDLGQWIAAPYCAAMLGDFGAEVIKVEKPQGGDDQRQSSPFVEGRSAFFNLFNRNKRSVSLDLASDAGRQQLWNLIETADILIENYRPGAMARMGFDYDTVSARNPRLIYCSISGFGQTGPMRKEGGFDLVIQAMSGLASLCGAADGQPQRLPIPIVDVSTALFATIGILTAIQARTHTGKGQYVDVALLDSALAMAPLEVAHYLATGNSPQRLGQASRNAAPYQLFTTRDGSLALGAAAQHLWEKTCDLIGAPELKDDPRFATNALRMRHNADLAELIERQLVQQTTSYWLERLAAAGVPAGPVLTYEEILNHPQVEARRLIRTPERDAAQPATMINPIQLSETPARLMAEAPDLGAHNAELLSPDPA